MGCPTKDTCLSPSAVAGRGEDKEGLRAEPEAARVRQGVSGAVRGAGRGGGRVTGEPHPSLVRGSHAHFSSPIQTTASRGLCHILADPARQARRGWVTRSSLGVACPEGAWPPAWVSRERRPVACS